MLYRLIVTIFLTTLIMSNNSYAGDVYMAVVTADSLNVRKEKEGEVIDSLKKGQKFAITKVSKGWAYGMYVKSPGDKKYAYGWVSGKYIKIFDIIRSKKDSSASAPKNTISGDHCSTESESDSDVCVTVTSYDLSCSEDYKGNKYNSCDLYLNYSIETNYIGDSSIQAYINCDVEISKEGRDIHLYSEIDSSTSLGYYLDENGSDFGMESFIFTFHTESIQKVRVSNLSCYVSGAYL